MTEPTNAAPSGSDDEPLDVLLQREFSRDCPVRDGRIYANHAAIAPWPRSAAEAVRAFAQENFDWGPTHYRDWIVRERNLRSRLAELIGAGSAADIALLKNTTEGICMVAFGLDWRRGDRVVITDTEFPSNRLPWEAQSVHGVTVDAVAMREADDAEQALIDALDERTRVLAVSAVQWNDGFRLDLGRLGQACADRGVLFCVDAIQQLGALPVDVTACQASFLAADAHKWLLGPEGTAVFYSSPSARPQLRLQQVGWHMFENPWAFDRDNWTPAHSAKRFEAGTPNSMGQAALLASVELLITAGPAEVERRVLRNTAHLVDGLKQFSGVSVVSRTSAERASGIVAFNAGSRPIEAVYRALRDANVESGLRGGAIRLSPHFYQGEPEMEELLRRVRGALGD